MTPLFLCLLLSDPPQSTLPTAPPQVTLPTAPPQVTLPVQCQCSDGCACRTCFCKVLPKCNPACTCDPAAPLAWRDDTGPDVSGWTWRPLPGGQHALHNEHGVQVGAYHHGRKLYRAYDATAGTWGEYASPPVTPPAPRLTPAAPARLFSRPAFTGRAAGC